MDLLMYSDHTRGMDVIMTIGYIIAASYDTLHNDYKQEIVQTSLSLPHP